MTLPRCTDLSALAAAVEGQRDYARLGTLIKRALLAQSCGSDLKQAQSIFVAWDHVRQSPRGVGTPNRNATEAAQLFACVSLYSRGTWTSTNKGARGSINIAHELSPDQLSKHCEIIDVRNKALAHVYSSPVAGDIWHDDLLIAVEAESGWSVGGASRKTLKHGPTWENLRIMLPIASSILERRIVERMNKVSDLLNANRIQNSELEAHMFDPVVRFGSLEAAQSMMPGGSGTAYVKRAANTVRHFDP